MGQLTNLYVSQSFQGLLKMTDSTNGLTSTLQTVQTGDGDNSPLQMSLTQVNISGSFTVNNIPITGGTGSSGTSGSSGVAGSSGTSGTSGVGGSSGTSGTSGQDGSSGTSGTSGGTGSSGTSGTSGQDGSSGTSGTSGGTGSSGTSGTSGQDGSSGTSGVAGSSGTSGTDGSSGTSGVSPSLVGVITTGSITTTQSITGSLNVTGSLNEIGDLFIISPNQTTDFSNVSSSNKGNIIFGAKDNVSQVSQTGSYVISGSNNIIQGKVVPSVGYYSYISGSNNIINSPIYLSTGSVLRPIINNNNIGGGTITFNYTTSSLGGGQPQFQDNLKVGGGSLTLNHQSGSGNVNSNFFLGNNIFTSTQNNISSSAVHTITSNLFLGTQTLNHVSSSITADRNIFAGLTSPIINNFYSSSVNNGVTVSRNLVFGQNHGIYVSGSNTSNSRQFFQNFIGGNANIVSSSYISGTSTSLANTMIMGNQLFVSASSTSTTNGGSTFIGRFNATGSLQESSEDAVFVVGTGTGVGSRRNALHIDSNNNTRITGSVLISGSNHQTLGNVSITGSLNVSGAMTLGYNDGTDNITSISQGAGTILYRNANKYTTAIGEFTGTQNKFADGTNNILLGGFNSQFSTGSQNFLVVPTGGNFKSGSINIIIGNTENITSGSQNILIGQMPSSLGPRVDAHFVVKSQSESNSYLFKSGSGANVPIQIGFPVQVTGSLNVNGNTTITGSLNVSGNVLFASGSNTTMGTFVLDGGNPGVATVSNSLVSSTSLIFLTKQTNVHSGNGTVSVTSKGTGTFSVTSNHNGDTDTVAYLIINPV